MKGKYKRKRLNKKYKRYAGQFKIWREKPSVFIKDIYNVELNFWQKIYIDKIMKVLKG